MSPEQLFRHLALWRALGWIRQLDEQFALFLHRLDSQAPAELLLAAALTSHQLGRGHVCLALDQCLENPLAVLALPPEDQETIRWSDPDLDQRRAKAKECLRECLQNLKSAGLTKALQSAELVSSGGDGTAPLVFDRGNLYLRRTWTAETSIATAVSARASALPELPAATELGALIREIFGERAEVAGGSDDAVDWQQVACAIAARSRFSIISGGPGTGKTWTVVRIIALLQRIHLKQTNQALRIRLAAPTGKAAQRLSESIAKSWQELASQSKEVELVSPEPASTLHRLLGSQRHTRHFRHNHVNPLPVDVVIVDEASMIDQEMMQSLLDALAPGTRLILLGDKDQLASVEAGAVFGDLCRDASDIGYSKAVNEWLGEVLGSGFPQVGPGGLVDQRVMLKHNYRSTAQINALARAVNAGQESRVVELLKTSVQGELNWPQISADDDGQLRQLLLHGSLQGEDCEGYLGYLKTIRETREALVQTPDQAQVDAWVSQCLQAYGRFQVLTAFKSGPWGVAGINQKVGNWLRTQHADIHVAASEQDWFDGRPIMMTRNDYSTGLMNGDIGLCLKVPIWNQREEGISWQLRVVFPKSEHEFHYISPSRISDYQTAWAMTVHKAQGSEFEHAVLVLPHRPSPVLTRELIYTGLTRARERFTLVAANPAVLSRAIKRRTQRSSALADRLTP